MMQHPQTHWEPVKKTKLHPVLSLSIFSMGKLRINQILMGK